MLNHIRQGRGEPLVLVHGIGSHLQMWSPVLDRLADEHDVLALDLPGFGRSPQLGHEPTVEALTDAVIVLAREQGMERPHVAGNSLGRGIALELARTGRARSATGLSPIGFARGRERSYGAAVPRSSRTLARLLGHTLDAPQRSASGRTLTLGHLIGRPWHMPAADAIRATHDLPDSPGFDATLPDVIDFDWAHGDLGVPVTIGRGTRDMLLIPRQARRARRLIPRARHVWLRGCGHVPTWDDPEQVASVLLAGARGA